MAEYQRAVPVLQVVDVARSMRWYREVLGFAGGGFPEDPPHTFAILTRDGAEIMLQCASAPRGPRPAGATSDPEFLWSVYLRVGGAAILEIAAEAGKKAPILRGPERMFYGMVEAELCDPDGYRICLGGEAPAGADIPMHRE